MACMNKRSMGETWVNLEKLSLEQTPQEAQNAQKGVACTGGRD